MRPASLSCLVFLGSAGLFAGIGCSRIEGGPIRPAPALDRSVPARRDAGTVPDAGVDASSSDNRLVHIQAFDCEKLQTFPGLPRTKGPVVQTNGIRSWNGGGPLGANWNVDDLRCTVVSSTNCRRGKLGVVLRVGRVVVGARQVALTGQRSIDIEVEIPLKAWRHNLDEPDRGLTVGVPFRTGMFRATAVVNCSDPVQAGPKESRYTDVTDDSLFVAGFASGE